MLVMSKFRLCFCRKPASEVELVELRDRVRVLENVVFGCVKR